ncbi:hypothetical protein BJF83_20640 [Nocardiopsis sp. CNR-923]|uniref:hypothetical protein n=1 Tax=Nocardiopsis sp. CNR-923 TaxID=1904965 RepID=UPI0009697B57|nr:hypothetical protein [Nocardiopsis sp. CNR-923]OLT26574.1 hypothetical protein BJF83_20640 [Nocardiopsis sp. CNR-923]
MSLLHRSCTEQIRALEAKLREAQRREVDHTLAAAALRSERDRAESERWDAAGEAELLKEKLSDAFDREADLERQVRDLQYRVLDLEQDADDHQQVLEARRRRAAEHALADAWYYPGHTDTHAQAAAAQAILALPLASFDVTVTHGPGRDAWYVDGVRLPKEDYFRGGDPDPVDVLRRRYGLADGEIAQIREGVRRQEHDEDEDTPVVI